jgi:hypothetical protein
LPARPDISEHDQILAIENILTFITFLQDAPKFVRFRIRNDAEKKQQNWE